MSTPQVGAREDDPNATHVMEWTGDVWAPVCPRDNIPMVERDSGGWLACGTCGRRPDQARRGDR